MAEEIKINIGTAYFDGKEEKMVVKGRSLLSGLPQNVEVTSSEICEALQEPLEQIVEAVHSVLERTPPELAADISDKGMVLTGGGALLKGMDRLLRERMQIPVYIANDPISCVALGAGKALESLELLEKSETVIDIHKIR